VAEKHQRWWRIASSFVNSPRFFKNLEFGNSFALSFTEERGMKTKLVVLTLLLGASSLFAAGRFSFGIGVGPGFGYGPAYYYAPPPPAYYPAYAYAPAPGIGYSWINGYWYPYGGRYLWRAGYWARPPYAGAVWFAPRYAGGRYFRGYWGRR
jgi:WXXGXW repeat (2 copies)